MSYDQSARLGVYDAIYTHMKSYPNEAARLVELIGQYLQTNSKSILMVAPGTGLHEYTLLKLGYPNITGLDQSPAMLEVARGRNPGVTYHQGNMQDFNLGQQYAVVANLFSAIGHIGPNELHKTIRTHARHTLPGGVIIIEPWIMPHMWQPDHLTYNVVNEPSRLIVRTSRSTLRDGNITEVELSHLVVTPERSEYFVERHTLTMFTEEEFMAAFQAAGLKVWYLPEGLSGNGRGIFIGRQPLR